MLLDLSLLHPEDRNSSLWCWTHRVFCTLPLNYMKCPDVTSCGTLSVALERVKQNWIKCACLQESDMKDAHECELRVVVQTICTVLFCSVLSWIVFSGSGSVSPRLLRMCEFNYLSGGLPLRWLPLSKRPRCQTQHGPCRCGPQRSQGTVSLSGKCLSASSRGAKGKSSQAWILNDPGLTLVHLQICAWPRPSRKEVSWMRLENWTAVMVLTLDLRGVFSIAGICFDSGCLKKKFTLFSLGKKWICGYSAGAARSLSDVTPCKLLFVFTASFHSRWVCYDMTDSGENISAVCPSEMSLGNKCL